MKVTLILLMVAASAGAQESLPPGAGRTLVLEACVQCHDIRAITSQQKSEAAWRRTVNEMIWRGAPLMPGEVDVVAKYFARGGEAPRLSGQPKASVVHASALPAGRGRELVLSACVQCHALETTTSQRKTRDEWRHSVEQMARLGAKLNGSEVQVVTNYLSRAFGRPQ